MANRPVINLVDNPVAISMTQPTVEPEPPASERPPRPASPPRAPRPRSTSATSTQATNPYAGMRKVQTPVRLFPPLWDRLEQLVRELGDEGLEADKTALLNAMMHFRGPVDTDEARDLINRWRALLGCPPPPRT